MNVRFEYYILTGQDIATVIYNVVVMWLKLFGVAEFSRMVLLFYFKNHIFFIVLVSTGDGS